ncbi:hypothetical protein QP446_01235 [Corynebacterium riegelii]|uniref:hypothetical protein n=1 Tax=Corynebacterium riegelii TaxID=156976 RepID=UPI00254AB446|nr:hypothetical protein [Corynebacterium riegelii]MDK7179392.1 hypothetical protein [Corynebacterium riegelii]
MREEVARSSFAALVELGRAENSTFVAAFEAAYPEFKNPGNKFLAEPAAVEWIAFYKDLHLKGDKLTEAQEEKRDELDGKVQNLVETLSERMDRDLPGSGVAFAAYLGTRLSLASEPEDAELSRYLDDLNKYLDRVLDKFQVVGDTSPDLDDSGQEEGEEEEKDVAIEVADDLKLSGKRREAFLKAFREELAALEQGINDASRPFEQYQKELEKAKESAKKACAAGGNSIVAFPTKIVKGDTGNPSKDKPDNNEPDAGTPGGDAGSAADSDAGKTAGIVVGVIAALAAIAGAIAFLAPQLGIMLPQLPF